MYAKYTMPLTRQGHSCNSLVMTGENSTQWIQYSNYWHIFFPQFASEVIYKINMIAILWVLSVFCWKIRVPSISERNASLCSDVFFFFLYFIYLWFYLWSLRNVVHYISGATVHQSSFYMNKLLIWQWLTENSRLSVILFYFFNKRVVNNLIHKISNYQLQKY